VTSKAAGTSQPFPVTEFSLLVVRAPAEMRFVLGTRHDIRLTLHRLRLAGELAEPATVSQVGDDGCHRVRVAPCTRSPDTNDAGVTNGASGYACWCTRVFRATGAFSVLAPPGAVAGPLVRSLGWVAAWRRASRRTGSRRPPRWDDLVVRFSCRFALVGLESTLRTEDRRCTGHHFRLPRSRPLL
jgi:hypothetical protein